MTMMATNPGQKSQMVNGAESKNRASVMSANTLMKSTSLFGRLARHLQTILVLTALPVSLHAQFLYRTNNGAITITGYSGPGGAVTIPDSINSLPVTGIGSYA